MKQKSFIRFAMLTSVCAGLLFSCRKDQLSLNTQKPPATVVQNNGMVVTPYGEIPASHVFAVDNNTTVKISNGHLQMVALSTGKMVRDLGALSAEELSSTDPYAYAATLKTKYTTAKPAFNFGSNTTSTSFSQSNISLKPGIIAATNTNHPVAAAAISAKTASNAAATTTLSGTNYPGYYMGADIGNIQSFSTKWIVPDKPLDTVNTVTTFLWNGLSGGALQPVLQWDQGYGPNYTIANWYFVAGNYFHGTFVPVSVGAQLEGVITYISHTDTTWTYKESFTGYPAADVTVVRTSEATGLAECWEAYTSLLSKWPDQPFAAMTNIHLTTRTGTPPATISWYGINDGPVTTPSGYNSVVVNASSSNGEIDFYFGDGTGISPDSTYKIFSAVNGTSVLDVTAGGTTNGTYVELWSNNSPTSPNQEWKVVSVGDGYYKLLPKNALTKALDVTGGSAADGTQIEIYTDNSGNAQKWKITPAGNGYCNLSPACAPASSLDINNNSTANGTKVQIWASNTTNAQKFKFVMQ